MSTRRPCVSTWLSHPRRFERDTASQGAIRAVVAKQVAAWSAGDGSRYARHVAPEVSFTNRLGMVMYGAPASVERHRQIVAGFLKG